MFGVNKFRASHERTKGTGETKGGAESEANLFSPALMLFLGGNSGPNSGRIPRVQALAAPGVRIRPSPPHSLYYLPTIWR